MGYAYEKNGAAIYERSFAIIRAEADLSRFDADEEKVAVRMIHASGMVDLAGDIIFAPGFAKAAKAALRNGAPILCDARMVSEGVTRARLPADNPVICTLQDLRVPDLAAQMGTTRSAAAMELWRPHLEGAVIAIGMAFRALNGRKSVTASVSCAVSTTGRERWLSTPARPWPGICLITGSTPPSIRPWAASRPRSMTICASSP